MEIVFSYKEKEKILKYLHSERVRLTDDLQTIDGLIIKFTSKPIQSQIITPIPPKVYHKPTYVETKIKIIEVLKLFPKSHTKVIVKKICQSSDVLVSPQMLAPLCYRIMMNCPNEFIRTKNGKRIRWSLKQNDLP